MKIFLVSTPKGEDRFGVTFQKLYTEVEKLGYTNVSDFISLTHEDFISEMSKGKDSQIRFYNEMIKSIQLADICIFEASTPSFGIGYLIEKALSNSKPTIVLFYKQFQSFLISGISDEKLIVKVYDEKNYRKVLKDSLDQAREKRDKRFNFFLSPKLLDYLEQASKKEGITKSKLIRDLIVDHMRTQNPTEEITEY